MKKTMSFATIHMGVAFSVGYVMTGDIAVGGAMALVEPMCNTVAFYFHEKVWNRIKVDGEASFHHHGAAT